MLGFYATPVKESTSEWACVPSLGIQFWCLYVYRLFGHSVLYDPSSPVGPSVGRTPEVPAVGLGVVYVLGMGERPVRVQEKVYMASPVAFPDKLSMKKVIQGGRWAL